MISSISAVGHAAGSSQPGGASGGSATPIPPIVLTDTICSDNTSKLTWGMPDCGTALSTDPSGSAGYVNKIARQEIYSFYKGWVVQATYVDDSFGAKTAGTLTYCRLPAATPTPTPTPSPTPTPVAVQTPICSISDGEGQTNWLTEDCGGPNPPTAPSNGYCDYANSTNPSGDYSKVCPRESAWFRGARVAIWEGVAAQLANELKNRAITVSTIGGVQPCASFATGLLRMIQGYPAGVDVTKQTVPGLVGEQDFLTKLNGSLTPEQQLNASNPCPDPNSPKGPSGAAAVIGMGACNLVYAHQYALMKLDTFLACEFTQRSADLYYQLFFNQDAFFAGLYTSVFAPCRTAASAACNMTAKEAAAGSQPLPAPAPGKMPDLPSSSPSGSSGSSGGNPIQAYWQDPCVRQKFFSCYINGSGGSGTTAQSYTKSAIQTAIQAKLSLPSPAPSLLAPPLSSQSLIDPNTLSLCAAGGLLIGRRRRRKTSAAKRLLLLALGALALLLAAPLAQAQTTTIPTSYDPAYLKKTYTVPYSCADGSTVQVPLDPNCILTAFSQSCVAHENQEVQKLDEQAKQIQDIVNDAKNFCSNANGKGWDAFGESPQDGCVDALTGNGPFSTAMGCPKNVGIGAEFIGLVSMIKGWHKSCLPGNGDEPYDFQMCGPTQEKGTSPCMDGLGNEAGFTTSCAMPKPIVSFANDAAAGSATFNDAYSACSEAAYAGATTQCPPPANPPTPKPPGDSAPEAPMNPGEAALANVMGMVNPGGGAIVLPKANPQTGGGAAMAATAPTVNTKPIGGGHTAVAGGAGPGGPNAGAGGTQFASNTNTPNPNAGFYSADGTAPDVSTGDPNSNTSAATAGDGFDSAGSGNGSGSAGRRIASGADVSGAGGTSNFGLSLGTGGGNAAGSDDPDGINGPSSLDNTDADNPYLHRSGDSIFKIVNRRYAKKTPVMLSSTP